MRSSSRHWIKRITTPHTRLAFDLDCVNFLHKFFLFLLFFWKYTSITNFVAATSLYRRSLSANRCRVPVPVFFIFFSEEKSDDGAQTDLYILSFIYIVKVQTFFSLSPARRLSLVPREKCELIDKFSSRSLRETLNKHYNSISIHKWWRGVSRWPPRFTKNFSFAAREKKIMLKVERSRILCEN